MKKKRLHVSLRMRKFVQTNIQKIFFRNAVSNFIKILRFSAAPDSNAEIARQALMLALNGAVVSMLLMQKLSKYLPKVKETDPATGKTLIGALKAI